MQEEKNERYFLISQPTNNLKNAVVSKTAVLQTKLENRITKNNKCF